jgi:hypothetical protein
MMASAVYNVDERNSRPLLPDIPAEAGIHCSRRSSQRKSSTGLQRFSETSAGSPRPTLRNSAYSFSRSPVSLLLCSVSERVLSWRD